MTIFDIIPTICLQYISVAIRHCMIGSVRDVTFYL